MGNKLEHKSYDLNKTIVVNSKTLVNNLNTLRSVDNLSTFLYHKYLRCLSFNYIIMEIFLSLERDKQEQLTSLKRDLWETNTKNRRCKRTILICDIIPSDYIYQCTLQILLVLLHLEFHLHNVPKFQLDLITSVDLIDAFGCSSQ